MSRYNRSGHIEDDGYRGVSKMDAKRTEKLASALAADRYSTSNRAEKRGWRRGGGYGSNKRGRGYDYRGRRGGHSRQYSYSNGYSQRTTQPEPVYDEEENDDSLIGKLKKDIRCCWDEDKNIVIYLKELIVLQILSDGKFEISCPLDKRTEEAACVISAVLRPFNLHIEPKEPNDYSSQWYLGNGKDYKVKCLDKSLLSGPASQAKSMKDRTTLVSQLIQAGCLFSKASSSIKITREEEASKASVDLSEGISVGDMKVFSPVQALYDFCKQKGWATEGLFWFDRSRKNGVEGYNWTIRILQYDITIGPSEHTWNPDKTVAKNLAAENALNVIRALSA